MENLLEHISAYDLLGNLVPGAFLYALLCPYAGRSFVDNVLVEIAVFAIYAVLLAFGRLVALCPAIRPCIKITGMILLILLFFFSYRKQTGYVNDRIKEQTDGEKQGECGKA